MKEWLLPPKAEIQVRESRKKTRTISHASSAMKLVIILMSVQRTLNRASSFKHWRKQQSRR